MTSKDVPPSQRVATSFKQLSAAALDLNSASDELGKAISAVDTALKGLNLGVPTWVTIHGGEDEYLDYWSRDVGYAKIDNKWGVALRSVSGNHNYPDEGSIESWLFSDAPRWLRIEGIAKIPDLLEALIKKTEETTREIKLGIAEANQVASAITRAAEEVAPRRNRSRD